MKNRILFGTMLALLLVGSVSFADDADKKRLLEKNMIECKQKKQKNNHKQ